MSMKSVQSGGIAAFALLEDSLPPSVITFWTNVFQSSKQSFLLVAKPLYGLVCYQPPVGIVTFWLASKWFQQHFLGSQNPLGRFLQVEDSFFPPVLQMLGLSARQKRPKSVELDGMDRDYNHAGGVQAQALQEYQREAAASHSDSGELVLAAIETAACPPQASRYQCAQQSVETLVQVLEENAKSKKNEQPPRDVAVLLEVRALDAMLRCIRDDEFLPQADQLRTRKEVCEIQLNSYYTPTTKQWIQRTLQGTIQTIQRTVVQRISQKLRRNKNNKSTAHPPSSLQEWRKQYQETSQQLQDQYERLGQLQELLLQQPQRKMESTDNNQDDEKQQKRQYLDECMKWNAKAKALLKDVLLHQTIMTSRTSTTLEIDKAANDIEMLKQWGDKMTTTEWSTNHWKSALGVLEATVTHKTAPTPSSVLESITQQWKFRNIVIPSALLKIALAKAIHHAVLPHVPWMKTTGHQIGTALWGIVEFRFYMPLKVILMDLLNRRPRLLDPAQLVNEQTSLNNMLRDLGIAVTDLDKADSLAQASRMYEEQLKQGAVKNMIFGKMVRLLLIQVQQLKAELLQAFQSIDELVDANRLNVSLLATIPAFLLVRWGSRILYSVLYRLRTRDVTGLKDAHMELTHRLRTLERILILASKDKDNHGGKGQLYLKGAQLGEFISQEQKYLLLLDYCQPPFPVKQVDSIYKDMQDLLPPGGLDQETQVNLLKLIHQKNADLLKSL